MPPPPRSEYHLEMAHALRQLGRSGKVVARFGAAFACEADFGDAWWSLATLKTYRSDDANQDVVTGLEGKVRRILGHLPLEFYAGCLEFHTIERTARTPGSEKVRTPIYWSALELWRHFELWLDLLKKTLCPLAERGHYRDK